MLPKAQQYGQRLEPQKMGTPILVIGAAGRVGGIGRTVTELLPAHLAQHLLTMAELHRAGRHDRLADSVERVTGRRLASEGLCPFTLISSAVISVNRLYAEQ
jgi:NAD(P)-dependent dehydrogenase (short-subunit alcohol dehydrogenase family)